MSDLDLLDQRSIIFPSSELDERAESLLTAEAKGTCQGEVHALCTGRGGVVFTTPLADGPWRAVQSTFASWWFVYLDFAVSELSNPLTTSVAWCDTIPRSIFMISSARKCIST